MKLIEYTKKTSTKDRRKPLYLEAIFEGQSKNKIRASIENETEVTFYNEVSRIEEDLITIFLKNAWDIKKEILEESYQNLTHFHQFLYYLY